MVDARGVDPPVRKTSSGALLQTRAGEGGGTADAADLKSAEVTLVWVRIPPFLLSDYLSGQEKKPAPAAGADPVAMQHSESIQALAGSVPLRREEDPFFNVIVFSQYSSFFPLRRS